MTQPSVRVSEDVSKKISNMGIICAFLVLFIHLPRSISPNYIATYISNGIGNIAVPFFFTVSGYLLAGHFTEEGWYSVALIKRIRTLYIPMVIWCVLYFLWGSLVIPMLSNIVHGRFLFANISLHVGIGTVSRLFALHPFAEPYLGVLWFVKTLLVFVAFAPILRRISSPIVILCMFVAQLLLGPTLGGTPPPLRFTLLKGYFPICGASFFCLGMFLRSHNYMLKIPRKIGWSFIAIGIVLMVLKTIIQEPLLKRLTFFYIPFLMAGAWFLCPTKLFPAVLVKASFAVYILHMFVIGTLTILFTYLWGDIWVDMDMSCYVALGLLSFTVCVLLSFMANKLLPQWLSNILFGGR